MAGRRGTIGGVAIIALLHGPNLNLLGQREPHIYGSATLDDYVAAVAAAAAQHGHTVEAFQSNHEGALVDAIVVEVHLSNPQSREPWRHTSVVAPVATGSITGLGMHGYELAVQAVVRRLAAA